MTDDQSRRPDSPLNDEGAELPAEASQDLDADEAPLLGDEPAAEEPHLEDAEPDLEAEPAAPTPATTSPRAPRPATAKGTREVGYRGSLAPRNDHLARPWVITVIGIFVLILVLALAGLPSRLFPEPSPEPIPSFSLEPVPSASVAASPQ